MHLIAVAAVFLAIYVAVALFSPTRPCPRCSGGGTRGRSRKSCGKCGATGRAFRPGARLLHKGVTSTIEQVRSRR